MSIPTGAKWIYDQGKKIGVRLSSGKTVSRSEGEKLGARQSGYKNVSAERKASEKRRDFFSKSENRSDGRLGKLIDRARKQAKAEGRRFDKRTVETAYWRAHTAGTIYKDAASQGGQVEADALKELQDAMSALARITQGPSASYAFAKGAGTP